MNSRFLDCYSSALHDYVSHIVISTYINLYREHSFITAELLVLLQHLKGTDTGFISSFLNVSI